MADVQIKLNSAGVKALLRDPRVAADLLRRANQIAAAADGAANEPGAHTAEVETGPNRARAAVYTETPRAMALEARDRTLTHSLDAGRA